jgi:hypothetical protein
MHRPEPGSHRRRQDTFILDPCGPHCSTTSWRNGREASSYCELRIQIRNGQYPVRSNGYTRIYDGLGYNGMKVRGFVRFSTWNGDADAGYFIQVRWLEVPTVRTDSPNVRPFTANMPTNWSKTVTHTDVFALQNGSTRSRDIAVRPV